MTRREAAKEVRARWRRKHPEKVRAMHRAWLRKPADVAMCISCGIFFPRTNDQRARRVRHCSPACVVRTVTEGRPREWYVHLGKLAAKARMAKQEQRWRVLAMQAMAVSVTTSTMWRMDRDAVVDVMVPLLRRMYKAGYAAGDNARERREARRGAA